MAKEAKQDFGENPVEGMSGKDAAKKYLDGNLQKPEDGYNGYQNGSSSLVNNATITPKGEKADLDETKEDL